MQDAGTGQDAAGDEMDRAISTGWDRDVSPKELAPRKKLQGVICCGGIDLSCPRCPQGQPGTFTGVAVLPSLLRVSPGCAATSERWKTPGKGSGERETGGPGTHGWGEEKGEGSAVAFAHSQSKNSWCLVHARGISSCCQETSSCVNQSLCPERPRNTLPRVPSEGADSSPSDPQR